ncbi:MAG: DUF927 domain-containing protein, partial [Anaerolineae bacterium]|nr:DUF927 domain-containing protein [Anaerolineae bacterium]
MEDLRVVTSFLDALYGQEPSGWANHGWLEVRYLADGEKPAQRWYRPQDVPLDKLQAGNQAGRNVYFGVGLRRKHGGKKGDVLGIPALWVDLDGKDFPEGKPEALAALDRLPPDLSPSIVLDSGHGIHAYWLLEPSVALNGNGEVERVEGILRGLAQQLGGDPAVADVARIMRLPGFLNVKDPENPVPCQLLEVHPERRFDLAAFSGFEALVPSQSAVSTAEVLERPRLPTWTLDFLARGTIQGERNNVAFATACQLRDAGYPEPEALAMVLEGAARCAPPLPEWEVEASVKSAYSRPPREPLADRRDEAAAAQAEQPASAPAPAPVESTWEEPKPGFGVFYTPDDAPILVRWQTSRGGSHRYQVPIARFVPRVIAETKRHKPDGEVVRTFDLQVNTWRSKPVISITPEVLADTRRFFAACMGAVGADARLIDPGAARYLPLAAMELAPEDRPRETIYEMTGWQEVGGNLCYLSPAGGVGVPEGVRVDLSNLEAGIGLSQDGLSVAGVADGGDDVFAAGLQALLSPVLDSFPRAVMLPALGFAFLAPLMHWSPVPDRPALHFIGSTGTRKTALLGLLQAFYGCPRFLLSWQSTGNHLEIAMSQTRDMLVSVDDLKANVSDRGVGRRVLQSYADRRGRGRATRSGELARARFAGGLLVSAGEDIPEGEASIAARSLFATIQRGAADLERLTEAQKAAPSLATVTARYITWLLDQGEPDIRKELNRRFVAHRDLYRQSLAAERGVNDAGRVATSCALILAGAEFLYEFLRSVGAVSPQQQAEMVLHTQLELLELAHSQARVMVEETYAQTFLSALRTMLETRDLYLVPVQE